MSDHPAEAPGPEGRVLTDAEARLDLAILDEVERSGLVPAFSDRRKLTEMIRRRLMQEGYRV